MQIKFDGVKGYATYENARKRGEEIISYLVESAKHDYRFLVVANPNGRFVPVFIMNDKVDVGWLIHQTNICVAN